MTDFADYRSPVLTRGGICVPPTVTYFPYRVSGSTLTAVEPLPLLLLVPSARRPTLLEPPKRRSPTDWVTASWEEGARHGRPTTRHATAHSWRRNFCRQLGPSSQFWQVFRRDRSTFSSFFDGGTSARWRNRLTATGWDSARRISFSRKERQTKRLFAACVVPAVFLITKVDYRAPTNKRQVTAQFDDFPTKVLVP